MKLDIEKIRQLESITEELEGALIEYALNRDQLIELLERSIEIAAIAGTASEELSDTNSPDPSIGVCILSGVLNSMCSLYLQERAIPNN